MAMDGGPVDHGASDDLTVPELRLEQPHTTPCNSAAARKVADQVQRRDGPPPARPGQRARKAE
jgi:hypothetical protein